MFRALIAAMIVAAASVAAAQEETSAPLTAYQDIEIWLGERVGRFGDYEFTISGGSSQYPTPTGAYSIEWKNRNHWSRQWDAPMPFAQFFCRGAAIHQGNVGGPSKGCVRVTPEAARYLFPRTKEGLTRVFVYP